MDVCHGNNHIQMAAVVVKLLFNFF